jgi:hypothetical protein
MPVACSTRCGLYRPLYPESLRLLHGNSEVKISYDKRYRYFVIIVVVQKLRSDLPGTTCKRVNIGLLVVDGGQWCKRCKFQCDSFSNLKGVSQRSISKLEGPVKNCLFYFGYFSMKLGTSIDGHEQIITWRFHWNRQEINGREPILSKICITANVHVYRKKWFCTTKLFICAETWNFSLAKKIRFEKNQWIFLQSAQ